MSANSIPICDAITLFLGVHENMREIPLCLQHDIIPSVGDWRNTYWWQYMI
jgi:hypothetical protein